MERCQQRVDVVERMLYEGLILDEQRRPARGESEAEIALLAGRVQAGRYAAAFADGESLPHFLAKLAAIKAYAPELGLAPPSDEQLQAVVHALCRATAAWRSSRPSLGDALLAALEAVANPASADRCAGSLARLAPIRWCCRGRRLRIHYEPGSTALGRFAPAGLLVCARVRAFRGARRWCCSFWPQPAAGAGDNRSGWLLAASLSRPASRARPSLSPPRLARRSAATPRFGRRSAIFAVAVQTCEIVGNPRVRSKSKRLMRNYWLTCGAWLCWRSLCLSRRCG